MGVEVAVRETIAELFGSSCALCTSTCCTPDICEESMDSAFLQAVRSVYEKNAFFCDRYGWLTESGCALRSGRPPVCYGFFCNEITDSLSEQERSIVRVLGRILSWVGERAIGQSHLVEILDIDDLGRMNCERITNRIAVAHLALDGVKRSLSDMPVDGAHSEAMHKVSTSYVG